MLVHSPRDRSRSPHRTNGMNSTIQSHSNSNDLLTAAEDHETTDNATKKENDLQLRLKSLKTFIQTLRKNLASLGSTSEEQIKALEKASIKEYPDLSHDRVRRMIRSSFKSHKSSPSSSSSSKTSTQQDATINDRFNSTESSNKKSRANSTSTAKPSDHLPPPSLSNLDSDFLRHAFSPQYRPSIDLSSYFSAAAAAAAAAAASSNGNASNSSMFRSNFLQTLPTSSSTLSSTLLSTHKHLNGNHESSISQLNKSLKLSSHEVNSIQVLINAYREAASYLTRSADELEQFLS